MNLEDLIKKVHEYPYKIEKILVKTGSDLCKATMGASHWNSMNWGFTGYQKFMLHTQNAMIDVEMVPDWALEEEYKIIPNINAFDLLTEK